MPQFTLVATDGNKYVVGAQGTLIDAPQNDGGGTAPAAPISANNPATADLDMGTNKVTNLGAPTAGGDGVTKTYADALLAGPLAGDMDAGSNSITNLAAPSAGGDATNKTYVDAQVAGVVSYGDIYLDNNATETTISVSGTFVMVGGGGGYVLGVNNGFSMPVNGRLRYDGAGSGVVQIVGNLSFTAAQNNLVFKFCVFKNGVMLPGSCGERKVGTGSDVGHMGLNILTTVATNDYFEVWVSNETDTSNLTVKYLNLGVLEINT